MLLVTENDNNDLNIQPKYPPKITEENYQLKQLIDQLTLLLYDWDPNSHGSLVKSMTKKHS